MQPQPTSHSPSLIKVLLGMVAMCCAFGLILRVEKVEQVIALMFIPASALHLLSAYRLRAGHPPLPLFNGESPRAHMWFAATSASMAVVVFAGEHLPAPVLWPLVAFGVASVLLGSSAEKHARARS